MFLSLFSSIMQELGLEVPSFTFTSAAISSKDCQDGSLFFALKGEKTDGHQFLKEVKEKGGVAAVVASDYEGPDFGLILIRVSSVVDTLQALAKAYLGKLQPKTIGITGSVGKTTTKEFIASLLEGSGRVWKSPGNANSQVGLPISLLNAPPMDFAVLEMGMNGKGHIEKLIQIAPVDIAVITKVELVHAEFFPEGKPEIARAKGEILSGKKETLAIFNEEINTLEPFKSFPRKKIAGSYRKGEEGIYFSYEGKEVGPFVLPFIEKHLIDNFVLAATAALYLGVKTEEIQERAKNLSLVAYRFQKVEKEGKIFINDAYNAASVSIIAALENLPKPKKGGKTIGVLGSVKELGAFSESEHKKIGEKAISFCDYLLCIGKEARPIVEMAQEKNIASEFHENIENLAQSLKVVAKEGDVILIKGSNSHGLWRLLELL